jgi:outer membrane protein TolC
MKMFFRIVPAAVALSVGVMVSPALAQNQDERARLDEIARNAAQQFSAARAEVDQTRPNPALDTTGTRVELTLDDAVMRALDRNLDIAVERLNPQVQDFNIARLRNAYKPTLNSTIFQQSRVQPPTNQLNGGNIVTNDTSTYNAGIGQTLPWGGGNFNVAWNNQKLVTNNTFANFNPTYNSNLIANYTQPLLRGLVIDTNRQQLKITAINRDISESQLKGTIATTLANVRNAYWEMLYATQALEVAKGSLDLAQKLVEDNKARVEVGTMAPLDVVQAEAEAASRRQALAQAEATLRTSELSLKRLIVNGTEDPLWRSTLEPVDRPTFRPEPLDVEAAVRSALQNRTDLDAARKTVESNDITLKLLHNQTLPALDLIANYQAQGLGGTQFIRQGTGLGSTIIDTIPFGYSRALSTLFGRDYPVWQVQLNVSYPIGGSQADATFARGRIQRNQAAAQLRSLELTVATDVTNAALQVESSLKRYEASSVARELSETRLQAEQSRFEVGLSTNFFVVQAQRDLATAQNTELRALLDYRRALVDYERSQQAPAARGGNTVQAIAAGGGGAGGAAAGN